MRDPVISIFHHKHGTSVSIVQAESSADFWENIDNHDRNNADEYIEDVPLPPLFSAAPDMLAALKALMEKFGAAGAVYPGESGWAAVEAARRAIDKAEKAEPT